VKIIEPSSGSTVKGTTSIVTKVASNVVWEDLYIDSAYRGSLGSLSSSSPNTFSWNSAGVSNGSHTISSKAYGNTGQQVGSNSVNVNVTN
jgi:hypothetical protein